jgi:hypothetical protein
MNYKIIFIIYNCVDQRAKQFVDLGGELRCKSISLNSQLLVKNTI